MWVGSRFLSFIHSKALIAQCEGHLGVNISECRIEAARVVLFLPVFLYLVSYWLAVFTGVFDWMLAY